MNISVLDHGYVRLIEAYGTGIAGKMDASDYEVGIIEAARQSTQKGFVGWEPAACDCIARFATPPDEEEKHDPKCSSIKHPGDRKLLSYLISHQHNTPFEFAGLILEVQAPIFVFREWHRHRTQSYNEMSARYTPLPDLYYVPDAARLAMAGGSLFPHASPSEPPELASVPDVEDGSKCPVGDSSVR